jgi:hypothetical protein
VNVLTLGSEPKDDADHAQGSQRSGVERDKGKVERYGGSVLVRANVAMHHDQLSAIEQVFRGSNDG